MTSERQILTNMVHAEWKLCLEKKLKSELKEVLRKLKSWSEEPDKDVTVGTTMETVGDDSVC